jgi:hypothetical protein
MDTAIYSCIPLGSGVRGAKLIFSSAAAGGLIGGLQPVADGQWSIRLQNAGVGAIVGGVGAPLIGKVADVSKAGMLRLYDIRRARQTVISTSSPAEIACGTGTLSTRQMELEKVWDLYATHGPTKSKREMLALAKNIRTNGIKEPIVYVLHNGEKYIVDGHHRAIIAEQLGIAEIPAIQVELPYKGYKTVEDLKWSPF